MKEYEYSVIIKRSYDVWDYTVTQEIDGKVEFLGWGYAGSAEEAADLLAQFLKEQFNA